MAELTEVGINDAEVDADLLIGHVLGQSRGQVQAAAILRTALSAADADTIRALSIRRS